MEDLSFLEAMYYSGQLDKDFFLENYYMKDREKAIKDRLVREGYDLNSFHKLGLDPDRISYRIMMTSDWRIFELEGFIIIDIIESNLILGLLADSKFERIEGRLRDSGSYKSIKTIEIDEYIFNQVISKIKQNKEIARIYKDIGDIPAFIEEILLEAIELEASDVHIEPLRDRTVIRFRVNGELAIVRELELGFLSEIVSRLKILSNLDIAEKRDVQDGEFVLEDEDKKYNFRLSIVPAIYGEKVSIRLLDSGTNNLSIGRMELGQHLGAFRKLIRRKSGLLIVTGPTGCGKTTTLYSILDYLKDDSINIMTIEDPVEYKLDGINQIQINNKIGFNFAKGLKAILRSDPEILMVGEIRDLETAINATRAAITGHLVLSSLHTNRTIDTVDRLIDIGVEPYMVGGSLIGVVSQRLVKLLCPTCKEAYMSNKYESKILGLEENTILFKNKGCKNCHNGYIGRKALYEVLVIDEEYREAIRAGKDIKPLYQDRLKDGESYRIEDQCISLIKSGLVAFDEIYNIGVVV